MNKIRIYLKNIRPEGLNITEKIPSEDVGLTKEDYFYFITPIGVDAKIERIKNMILAETHLTGTYVGSCVRCLKDVQEDLTQNFFLNFSIRPETEYIEMGEDIRQEVVLNLPVRLLCQEDCKGICMGCKVDLNEEECRCKKK